MCKLIHVVTNLLTKIIFIPHISNLNHIFLLYKSYDVQKIPPCPALLAAAWRNPLIIN